MEPQIEYARAADGVRLATVSLGAGPPLVIAATPPWSHILREYRIPAVQRWTDAFAERVRLIRYDCRGTGLSDRDGIVPTLDTQVRDLEAIVEHHGLRSFALWGAIGGSPASIVYTARHPERVSHLLLWGGYVKGSQVATRPKAAGAINTLMRDDWESFTNTFAHLAFGWSDSETAAQYAELTRAAISQDAMIALWNEAMTLDVSAEAACITTPTLVLVRRDAVFSGVAEARELTHAIPSARLIVLEGGAPAPFLGDGQIVIETMIDFMESEPIAESRPAPGVALTERETQVLRLLAGGRSGKEIAAELVISPATAQRHIANIYAKIGARGRVEAAAYAFERGIADPSALSSSM
jgi:pimeloyl-ACP methyl ester carboxylesterase/DNA-binding CsgD family transcriptional regulator